MASMESFEEISEIRQAKLMGTRLAQVRIRATSPSSTWPIARVWGCTRCNAWSAERFLRSSSGSSRSARCCASLAGWKPSFLGRWKVLSSCSDGRPSLAGGYALHARTPRLRGLGLGVRSRSSVFYQNQVHLKMVFTKIR